MMFLNRPKYQQHEPTASTSQFSSTDANLLTPYPGSYNRFEIENVDISRHICPVCDKSFRASSLLDIHMRVHVGAKPFVCPVCNHRATQKGNLKLHMKKHHGLDLPSHIDLIPDSGIWGNFPQNGSIEEMQLNAANKKKTALAHSSLLNKEVVDIIKKCQNNIGQSTMGRITESLHDFLNIAQKKIHKDDSKKPLSKDIFKHGENINANNNGYNVFLQSPTSVQSKVPLLEKELLISDNISLEEQSSNLDDTRNSYCYCKICGWKTTSAGYLNVHMRKHKAESHVCTICGRGFKETWYLKNHMRSHVHSFTTQFEHYQTEIFGNDDSIIANKLPSKDEERFYHELSEKKADCGMCLTCGLVFPKSILQTHNANCSQVVEKSTICNYCEKCNCGSKKNFFESLNLTANLTSKQRSKNIKSFNSIIGCLVCTPVDVNTSLSISKMTSENLQNSIDFLKKELKNSIKQNGVEITKKTLSELTKNPNFNFLLSPQNFHSIFNIFDSKHTLMTETSAKQKCITNLNSPKPYKNAAMQSLADIGKSLATVKAEDDQTFSTTNSYEHDQQEQGFQCRFCFKWFRYRSVLGIHMRSHTGERPYKCGLCGYAGTQYNCLKLHMQRHHSSESASLNLNDEKLQFRNSTEALSADVDQEHMFLGQAAKLNPAKCPICARVSPSPGYLKIHMRSHKQTLDHVCHICGRGFKEYWYLATHLRTHDQEVNVTNKQLKESHVSNRISPQQTTTTGNSVDLIKYQTPPLSKSVTSPVCSDRNLSNSWYPLNLREDTKDRKPRFSSNNSTNRSLPPKIIGLSHQQYVSKRKAFQPSKFRAEPYLANDHTTRSRKSKPKKLSQDNIFSPSLNRKILNTDEKKMDEVSDDKFDLGGIEEPLDLSMTLTSSSISWDENRFDEPLNLAIKN